ARSGAGPSGPPFHTQTSPWQRVRSELYRLQRHESKPAHSKENPGGRIESRTTLARAIRTAPFGNGSHGSYRNRARRAAAVTESSAAHRLVRPGCAPVRLSVQR